MAGTVHIVDDNLAAKNLALNICAALGVEARGWGDPAQFLSEAETEFGKDDVLVLDIYMPGKDAIEVLKHFYTLKISISVILVSGRSAEALTIVGSLAEAFHHQVIDRIQKPLTTQKLREALTDSSLLPA